MMDLKILQKLLLVFFSEQISFPKNINLNKLLLYIKQKVKSSKIYVKVSFLYFVGKGSYCLSNVRFDWTLTIL